MIEEAPFIYFIPLYLLMLLLALTMLITQNSVLFTFLCLQVKESILFYLRKTKYAFVLPKKRCQTDRKGYNYPSNENSTHYILYGRIASLLYDKSFTVLMQSGYTRFQVLQHCEDDFSKVMEHVQQWGDCRRIEAYEYGLLLGILEKK